MSVLIFHIQVNVLCAIGTNVFLIFLATTLRNSFQYVVHKVYVVKQWKVDKHSKVDLMDNNGVYRRMTSVGDLLEPPSREKQWCLAHNQNGIQQLSREISDPSLIIKMMPFCFSFPPCLLCKVYRHQTSRHTWIIVPIRLRSQKFIGFNYIPQDVPILIFQFCPFLWRNVFVSMVVIHHFLPILCWLRISTCEMLQMSSVKIAFQHLLRLNCLHLP